MDADKVQGKEKLETDDHMEGKHQEALVAPTLTASHYIVLRHNISLRFLKYLVNSSR